MLARSNSNPYSPASASKAAGSEPAGAEQLGGALECAEPAGRMISSRRAGSSAFQNMPLPARLDDPSPGVPWTTSSPAARPRTTEHEAVLVFVDCAGAAGAERAEHRVLDKRETSA